MENVKKIITNASYESFNLNKDVYLDYNLDNLQNLAIGFWDNRSDKEIKRDKKLKIDQNDYCQWIEIEWVDWLDSQKKDLDISSIDDLEKWSNGTNIIGQYDFDRDLYDKGSNTVNCALPLSCTGNEINFVFEVVKFEENRYDYDGWDSILRIKEIHRI